MDYLDDVANRECEQIKHMLISHNDKNRKNSDFPYFRRTFEAVAVDEELLKKVVGFRTFTRKAK